MDVALTKPVHRTRIARLSVGECSGPCEEPVRNLDSILPRADVRKPTGRVQPTGTQCSRARAFDVDGKRVCRWHAAALAFDILSREPRQ